MKLMTKEILNKIPKLRATLEDPNLPPGEQEGKGDLAIVYVKFFNPCGSWTWYATEFDPDTGKFFGLVKGQDIELGPWTLEDLKTRGRLGLPMERDMYFTPRTVGEIREKISAGGHV